MKLYLMRHAEPKAEEEDPQRPLTTQGWADARKIAAFISEHVQVQVNSILHSPKTRAQQTAQAMAEYLNPPQGIKDVAGLKPLDEPSIWAEQISQAGEDLMLVGHLPHLNKLAASLLYQAEPRQVINFPPAGVVCLQRGETGTWSLNWMLTPQIVS